MLLVLPIVLPLATAILLQLVPHHIACRGRRVRGRRWDPVDAVALLVRVDRGGIQVLQIGGGRRLSASPWSRTSSAHCSW